MSNDHTGAFILPSVSSLCLGCRMKPLVAGQDGLGAQSSHLTVIDQEPSETTKLLERRGPGSVRGQPHNAKDKVILCGDTHEGHILNLAASVETRIRQSQIIQFRDPGRSLSVFSFGFGMRLCGHG